MNQWYNERIQEKNQTQQPPSPTVPPVIPSVALPPPPPVTESSKRTPVKKLKKFGAEEFRGRSNDDPVKAEYWLQNTIRVFNEMACSPDDYLRCVVSLLKEEAYHWSETIEAVVPAEKLTWEFFQAKFKKKYIGKRYLEKKKREFLDLRQGNRTVAEYERESVASEASVQNTPKSKCQHCGKYHLGECRGKTGACYKCGATDHFIQNCLLLRKDKEEQKEKQIATSQKSKHASQSSAAEATRSSAKDYVARSEVRAPVRTYAIRAREEATALDVIAVLALEKKLSVEPTEYDVQVTNPLGQRVIVNLVCRNCPLKIKGCEFPTDLMLLPFREFDVILGMDWLTKYDVVVNCREKGISLKCQTGDILSVEPKNSNDVVKSISAFSAQRLMQKGNKSLPPDREVKFVIDVVPRTAPIPVTPYHIALAELKELKTQL
ncbi:uncharacterized protein [Gossypium hirsutum]|uniref:CCHC-type domain-containing protein n=1 Tax=Gossypium hirsutum TaxID=3635 RepID=A0A1U8PVW7_GOSHI|nr:uncharacterized protein LOC107963248 [Gossypium hirsutum]